MRVEWCEWLKAIPAVSSRPRSEVPMPAVPCSQILSVHPSMVVRKLVDTPTPNYVAPYMYPSACHVRSQAGKKSYKPQDNVL